MTQRTPRTSVITDWRVRDENDLPDIGPGEECERVIAPQKFVVLYRIIVRGPWASLVRLQIGAVPDVPFELESVDGEIRHYRPTGLANESIKKQLVKIGAAAATPNAIAIAPGLEVRLHLRNEGARPTKLSAALLVQEESS
jgi:hypothetical protein